MGASRPEHTFEKVQLGETETAPGGASTPYAGGLDADKERLMPDGINTRYVERKRLAAEFLTRAADDYTRATATRRRYAILARQYGLTYSDIGTFLGVSEAAARMLVKRHGGDA